MKNDFVRIFSLLTLTFLISCGSTPKSGDDKKAELYYTYGTQKLVDKEYSQALEALLNSNELRPNDTKTLNNLGLAYYFKKRPKTAKEYFQKAIKADKKNSDARNNLASLYFEQGNLDKAEQQYKEILKDLVYRYSYRTNYNLALIELKRNNTDGAIAYLDKVMGYTMDYCPAPFMLGKIYNDQGKYKKAIKNLNIATTGNCKEEPAPHFLLSEIYRKLGEDKKALTGYDLIIEKFPRSPYSKKSLVLKNNLSRKNYYSKTFEEDNI